jgi:hypothetical protein
MALPAGIALLKVHPAIGIARVSANSDYFVFGDAPTSYKSNNQIKRQAIRFSISAYDPAGREIGEYTADQLRQLGYTVVWHVEVANKKISRVRGDEGFVAGARRLARRYAGGAMRWAARRMGATGPDTWGRFEALGEANLQTAIPQYTIRASARSDQNNGKLVGNMQASDFHQGNNVDLGQILPDGLFLSGRGTVLNAKATGETPGDWMHSGDMTDHTCDGIVRAEILESGQPIVQKILEAWIVVGPPDFSPDFVDAELYLEKRRPNLDAWLVDRLGVPEPINQTAKEFDRRVLRSATSHFKPGIEMNWAADAIGNTIKELFYDKTITLNQADLRLDPSKIEPGDLTAYLCSPWQFDFIACGCSYWAAQRPDFSMRDETASVNWSPPNKKLLKWFRRKVAATVERLEQPAGGSIGDQYGPDGNAEAIRTIYSLGVVRKDASGNRVEKERLVDLDGGNIA